MVARIKVRAKPGKVAFDQPRYGKRIPHDDFVEVADTPYIRRLAEEHDDIEIQESVPEKKSTAKAAATTEK